MNIWKLMRLKIIQKRREEIEQKRLASNEDEVSSGYSSKLLFKHPISLGRIFKYL